MTNAADGGQRDPAAVATAPPTARVPATVLAEHQAAVAAISEAYAALPPGSPVRLAKRTSNLFRFRDPLPGRAAGNAEAAGRDGRGGPGPAGGGSRARAPSTVTGGLDASAFTRVLHVRPAGPPGRSRRHDHV